MFYARTDHARTQSIPHAASSSMMAAEFLGEDDYDEFPEPKNEVEAAPVAPPPSISQEQQILDDAEATGMTSRLPRDGEAVQPADEASNSSE